VQGVLQFMLLCVLQCVAAGIFLSNDAPHVGICVAVYCTKFVAVCVAVRVAVCVAVYCTKCVSACIVHVCTHLSICMYGCIYLNTLVNVYVWLYVASCRYGTSRPS